MWHFTHDCLKFGFRLRCQILNVGQITLLFLNLNISLEHNNYRPGGLRIISSYEVLRYKGRFLLELAWWRKIFRLSLHGILYLIAQAKSILARTSYDIRDCVVEVHNTCMYMKCFRNIVLMLMLYSGQRKHPANWLKDLPSWLSAQGFVCYNWNKFHRDI